jgi:hypothetical protein
VQPTISAYYHTMMGDVFVGFLCAYAMFLFAYAGYDKSDSRPSNLAGFLALGIVLFPADLGAVVRGCTMRGWYTNETIHLICAASFFLVLTYFSLFQFTKTHSGQAPQGQKMKRNRVYKVCGYVMLACLALIALYRLWLDGVFPQLSRIKPVFILESLALLAFGVSWLTKGETIWTD